MSDPVWGKLICLKKLRSLWLDVVKLPVCGINLENDVLYIDLEHPAYLQEWKMGEERYLELLRKEYKARGLKKIVIFKKIIVQLKITRSPQIKKDEAIERYEERSSGDFSINTSNPKLRKIFENIKELIRSKNDKQTESL